MLQDWVDELACERDGDALRELRSTVDTALDEIGEPREQEDGDDVK